ncbi:hypothetical protein DRH27_01275 [Candidatus Falkowbacteria bacterium]|nr:MAG: hypothetical protein DRH27_01275 [Candidatus Falkowbacteria bacterium]
MHPLDLRDNKKKGQQFSHQEANALIRGIKTLWKSAVSNGIIDASGISTRNKNSTSGDIHKAFVRTAPGETAILDCYLDTNTTGEEIVVTCEILDETALNSVVPRLEVGKLLYITYDGQNSVWRPLFPFQGSKDCESL